jgi:bacterioferritin-associated ferredoxin
MYVCLCKGLKESDVAMAARACALSGVEPQDVIEFLGLRCEEACGYCEANPQLLNDIFAAEFDRPMTKVRPTTSNVAFIA